MFGLNRYGSRPKITGWCKIISGHEAAEMPHRYIRPELKFTFAALWGFFTLAPRGASLQLPLALSSLLLISPALHSATHRSFFLLPTLLAQSFCFFFSTMANFDFCGLSLHVGQISSLPVCVNVCVCKCSYCTSRLTVLIFTPRAVSQSHTNT